MTLPLEVQSTDTFKTWRESTNTVILNVLDKTLNLSDVPNAVTARQNLGVEIGVDVAAENHNHDAVYEKLANKGVANGYASLDVSGFVPTSQLPSFVDDVVEYASLASFPATGETGKIYVALDTNKTYRWSGSAYVYITSGAVDSVNGNTGVVVLDLDDIGDGTTYKRITATDHTDLTDSGDSILHYHASDRNRANHTGTQLLSTISDAGSMASQDANNVNISGGSVSGITDLAVADGGTGVSTLTDGGVLVGNGTSPVQATGVGTSGQVLTSNGAGFDPTFQDPSGGGVTPIYATGYITPHRYIYMRTASASSLSVAAGGLTLRDTNNNPFYLDSVSEILDLTASGAGGLDTGSEASSTWYYVFVIAKADGTSATIFSLSFVFPTLPTEYVYAGLLGAVYNKSDGNLQGINQKNGDVVLTTNEVLHDHVAITYGTWKGLSVSAGVPGIASEGKYAIGANSEGLGISPRSNGAGGYYYHYSSAYINVNFGGALPVNNGNGEPDWVSVNMRYVTSNVYVYIRSTNVSLVTTGWKYY